jgi:protein-tyrosine phosphatase
MTPWPLDGPGVVELPDGRRVRGRSLRKLIPDGPEPEFGLYLLNRNPGRFEWPSRWVRWPDFRTPISADDAWIAFTDAYARAASERVEVGCDGGVGRTGTALAGIAVLAGVPRDEAVAWVRERYHPRAAEMPWQRRWLRKTGLKIS